MYPNSKTYLMILPVHYYRTSAQAVALESAFSEHLKLLKTKISPAFDQLIVGMVEMSTEDYEKKNRSLATIDEQQEGIFFTTLYKNEDSISRLRQFFKLLYVSNRVRQLIKDCDLLHTGLSSDIWFPMEFIATLWGIILKKPIVYFVDIDFRNSAQMSYKTGNWSLKSYLLCKYIYDPIRIFQINVAVSQCSLVLLKGKELCQDFGKEKRNVKNFLDAAHSEQHIINTDSLTIKLRHLKDNLHPLEVVYFGRLTPYKGVAICIQAITTARKQMGCNVIFHIIGDGEQMEDLKKLTKELNMEDSIFFYGAIPFNLDFFKKLYDYHLLLAAPLREDTPRSALDAMAAGIPILAFDTYYYRDLISTGAVDTVPWLSTEQLAQKIAYYSENRELLSEMVLKAIEFAKENNQEKWLDQRINWTLESL